MAGQKGGLAVSGIKVGDKCWVIRTRECSPETLGHIVTPLSIHPNTLLLCTRRSIFMPCFVYEGTVAHCDNKQSYPLVWLKKLDEPPPELKKETDELYKPVPIEVQLNEALTKLSKALDSFLDAIRKNPL